MIRFALKLLVMMLIVGYVVRLAEPVPSSSVGEPQFVAAAYGPETPEENPAEVARHLSSFTNAQIVVTQATRDAAGFCERQALACEAGRELIVRVAVGIRDVAAGIAGERNAPAENTPMEEAEEEYMPLRAYNGTYPILPAAPPPRYTTF